MKNAGRVSGRKNGFYFILWRWELGARLVFLLGERKRVGRGQSTQLEFPGAKQPSGSSCTGDLQMFALARICNAPPLS